MHLGPPAAPARANLLCGNWSNGRDPSCDGSRQVRHAQAAGSLAVTASSRQPKFDGRCTAGKWWRRSASADRIAGRPNRMSRRTWTGGKPHGNGRVGHRATEGWIERQKCIEGQRPRRSRTGIPVRRGRGRQSWTQRCEATARSIGIPGDQTSPPDEYLAGQRVDQDVHRKRRGPFRLISGRGLVPCAPGAPEVLPLSIGRRRAGSRLLRRCVARPLVRLSTSPARTIVPHM